MIVYFADRYFNIIGQASTNLPGGLTIIDDRRVSDVDSGVTVFEFTLPFNDSNRALAESCGAVGNYLLRSHGENQDFYTIIDAEVDTKRQEVTVYAEDAGLDLLNEIVAAYEPSAAQNIAHYINKFAYDSGFVIGVNECGSTTKKLSFTDDATAAERIAKVAEQFGCEISYSFQIDGLAVTKKLINIYKERGNDVGVQLRLNKEVDRIITKKSIANLATALLATGGTPENAENPINLSGYKYDDGDIFLEGRYLKSRMAIQKWSRYLNPSEPNTTYTGHILRKFSCDALTQAALCSAAVAELKRVSDVEVNYDIELHELPDGVGLGDRVNIVDDAGELYMSARILKLEESVANQSANATIGEYLIKDSGISQKVADLAAQFATSAAEVAAAYQAAQAAKTAAQTAQKTAETANQNVAGATTAAAQATAKAETAQGTAQAAQEAAGDAAKTATNFVEKDDTDGVIVGDKSTGDWNGYRAQVKADSFNVLDENGNVLSKFGGNEIELGNNRQDSVVKFCGDLGRLGYEADDHYDGGMTLATDGYLHMRGQFVSMQTDEEMTQGDGSRLKGTSGIFVDAHMSKHSNPSVRISSSCYLTYLDNGSPAEYDPTESVVVVGPDGITAESYWGIRLVAPGGVAVEGDLGMTGAFEPLTISVSAAGQTDEFIQEAFDYMANGTMKVFRLAQSVQDSLPVGGTWFVTIYKTSATYGVVTAIRYYAATAPAVVEYRRALYAGTWSPWEKVGGASIDTGTWTARINAGTISGQYCTYQKVGNMCTISFEVEGTGDAASATNTHFYITGVPYVPNSAARWYGGGVHVQGLKVPSGFYVTGSIIQSSNSAIYIRTCQSNADAPDGGYVCTNNGKAKFYLSGSITYPIAE